jgi:uncharacterized protein (DUF697 family)
MADEKQDVQSVENEEKSVQKKSDSIITQHVKFSMIAGAIPFPIVDIVAVTAIQMDMLKQLAATYGVDFNVERGKSLATSIMGATLGSFIGRLGASALKAIPGIGTLLGIGSQVVFAGASTFALGKVFQDHFESNGDLLTINLEEMKKQFEAFLKKGKEFAENLKGKQKEEDVFATIEKLKDLKDKGVITEKEFESTKKELLGKLSE